MDLQSPSPLQLPSSPLSVRGFGSSSMTTFKFRYRSVKSRALVSLRARHSHTPYLRRIPLPALLIITFIALVNCIVWAICGLILHNHGSLLATAALAYTLGLRHALDADHISAIDLMTRRLLAGDPKSRPVTVGTWFSLGHSTIVIITSIIVAATAAGISKDFGRFGTIGGIIGSSVSASFLILLGVMNAYILYKLIAQLEKILALCVGHEFSPAALNFEGGGPLFRILKRLFKLIDRPWKMYPIGIVFGLGFDTSSEIALLGISSIQASKGTSIWLIMVFPILFTAGMCLVDTMDGALMLAVYVGPMTASGIKGHDVTGEDHVAADMEAEPNIEGERNGNENENENGVLEGRLRDPIMFLYYSIVLTSLTVMVALIIGTIQLLTMVLNVTGAKGPFWDGVNAAGDNYEIIGGSICGSFIFFGGLSMLCYKPWRRRVEEKRVRRDTLRGMDVHDGLRDGEGDSGGRCGVVHVITKGRDAKTLEVGEEEPSMNRDSPNERIEPV